MTDGRMPKNDVSSMTYSPNSKLITIGIEGETAKICDAKSEMIQQSFKAEYAGMSGSSLKEPVEFGTNGKYLSVLEKSNRVAVYRTDESEVFRRRSK